MRQTIYRQCPKCLNDEIVERPWLQSSIFECVHNGCRFEWTAETISKMVQMVDDFFTPDPVVWVWSPKHGVRYWPGNRGLGVDHLASALQRLQDGNVQWHPENIYFLAHIVPGETEI